MKSCEQTSGMNMLQHGEMVHEFFLDLKGHVLEGKALKRLWKLPAWAGSRALWEHILDDQIIADYQIFHDCGKSLCRTVDEDGRQHFPGHAKASEHLWRSIGGDEQTCRLIGMDMDIHQLKAEGLDEFSQRPEAATLLLTGLAEIHANAQMFGGLDSNSFKAKWKHIDRRGKQIAKTLECLQEE